MDNVEGEYISVVIAAFSSLLSSQGTDTKFSSEKIENTAHNFKVMEREWFTDEMERLLIEDLNFLVNNFWEVLTDKKNRKDIDFNIRGILR